MTDSSNHEIERRKSFRLDMEKELIDIRWQDDAGNERTKKVACRDFSRGGIKIDSDIEFTAGTPIVVVFKANSPNSQELSGKVLRCNKQDNGWFEVAFQFEVQT